jgi:uncharacterized protein YPO0396
MACATRRSASISSASNRAKTASTRRATGCRRGSKPRRKLNLLRDRIIQAMVAYKEEFRSTPQEVDASIEAVFEYRNMLDKLQADDLPRFEARFKELLNENTIREVANFNAQLAMWRETIRERIARINTSLTADRLQPRPLHRCSKRSRRPTPTSATSRASCAPAPKGR